MIRVDGTRISQHKLAIEYKRWFSTWKQCVRSAKQTRKSYKFRLRRK